MKAAFRWGTAALSLCWFPVFFFFVFFFKVPLPFCLCSFCLHNSRRSQHYLCTQNTVWCVCASGGGAWCMRYTNEEQLANQSTLFKPAPLGSNRKYSQDFLSLLHALKQDTSAGPAYCVLTSFTTSVCYFANVKNMFHICFLPSQICNMKLRFDLLKTGKSNVIVNFSHVSNKKQMSVCFITLFQCTDIDESQNLKLFPVLIPPF